MSYGCFTGTSNAQSGTPGQVSEFDDGKGKWQNSENVCFASRVGYPHVVLKPGWAKPT